MLENLVFSTCMQHKALAKGGKVVSCMVSIQLLYIKDLIRLQLCGLFTREACLQPLLFSFLILMSWFCPECSSCCFCLLVMSHGLLHFNVTENVVLAVSHSLPPSPLLWLTNSQNINRTLLLGQVLHFLCLAKDNSNSTHDDLLFTFRKDASSVHML